MDRSRVVQRIGKIAIGVAIVVPGPLLLWVLLRNAVNVPFSDEWSWGALVVAMHAGTLSFNDVWHAHNEHRMLFPTLIALGLAKSFGWNVIFESVLGVTFLTLSQFALFRMTRDTLGADWGAFVFLVTSAVLFSFGQVENIMWGFQIAWFLIIFCTLSTIDLLRSGTARPIPSLFAACLCIIAAFSSAFGLFVPIIAVFLVVTRSVVSRAQVGIWVAFALLLVVAYMDNLHSDLSQSHLSGSLIERIVYGCAYLGSPVVGAAGAHTSAWIGAAGLGWAVACAIVLTRETRDRERRWAPWLALLLFGVGCASMTAYGRTMLGVDEALSSRYKTLGAQFWLALVPMTVLLLRAIARNASRHVRVGMSLAVLASFCLLIYGIGIESIVGYQTAISTGAARSPALAALERDPEKASETALSSIGANPSYVRETVEELRVAGYWPPR